MEIVSLSNIAPKAEEAESKIIRAVSDRCPDCGRAMREYGLFFQNDQEPMDTWQECPYCGYWED